MYRRTVSLDDLKNLSPGKQMSLGSSTVVVSRAHPTDANNCICSQSQRRTTKAFDDPTNLTCQKNQWLFGSSTVVVSHRRKHCLVLNLREEEQQRDSMTQRTFHTRKTNDSLGSSRVESDTIDAPSNRILKKEQQNDSEQSQEDLLYCNNGRCAFKVTIRACPSTGSWGRSSSSGRSAGVAASPPRPSGATWTPSWPPARRCPPWRPGRSCTARWRQTRRWRRRCRPRWSSGGGKGSATCSPSRTRSSRWARPWAGERCAGSGGSDGAPGSGPGCARRCAWSAGWALKCHKRVVHQ